jgi:hypothetical protein
MRDEDRRCRNSESMPELLRLDREKSARRHEIGVQRNCKDVGEVDEDHRVVSMGIMSVPLRLRPVNAARLEEVIEGSRKQTRRTRHDLTPVWLKPASKWLRNLGCECVGCGFDTIQKRTCDVRRASSRSSSGDSQNADEFGNFRTSTFACPNFRNRSTSRVRRRVLEAFEPVQ